MFAQKKMYAQPDMIRSLPGLIVTDPFAAVVHKSYGTPREPEAYLLDRDGRVDSVYTTRVDWHTVDFQKRVEKYIRLPGR